MFSASLACCGSRNEVAANESTNPQNTVMISTNTTE